jgi:hypothetical protein
MKGDQGAGASTIHQFRSGCFDRGPPPLHMLPFLRTNPTPSSPHHHHSTLTLSRPPLPPSAPLPLPTPTHPPPPGRVAWRRR